MNTFTTAAASLLKAHACAPARDWKAAARDAQVEQWVGDEKLEHVRGTLDVLRRRHQQPGAVEGIWTRGLLHRNSYGHRR